MALPIDEGSCAAAKICSFMRTPDILGHNASTFVVAVQEFAQVVPNCWNIINDRDAEDREVPVALQTPRWVPVPISLIACIGPFH